MIKPMHEDRLDDFMRFREKAEKQHSFYRKITKDAAKKLIKAKDELFYVIYMDGYIAGMMIVDVRTKAVDISRFELLDEAKDRRVGIELLNYALGIARNRKAKSLTLEIHSQDELAKKAAESCKFEELETSGIYIHLEREITPKVNNKDKPVFRNWD